MFDNRLKMQRTMACNIRRIATLSPLSTSTQLSTQARNLSATSSCISLSLRQQNSVSSLAQYNTSKNSPLGNFHRYFHASVKVCGGPRPWKKRGMPIAIHASQRPAEAADVDFSSLGLTYPVKYTPTPTNSRTQWTHPPAPGADGSLPTDGLPFAVDRTAVGGSLPVYTDYKAGGTKVITILRKCRGDVKILKDEMEKVVGKEVFVRPGKLVVDGNFNMRLKKWLAGLGF